MRKLFLILATVACFGIISAVTATEGLADGSCYEAKQAISRRLRDPGSAEFTCLKHVPSAKGDTWPVMVNAKNGFGGYTGDQMWAVVFLPDGRVEVFDPAALKAAGL